MTPDLFGEPPRNKREDELRRIAEPWIVERGPEGEQHRREFIEAFIEASRPRRFDGR